MLQHKERTILVEVKSTPPSESELRPILAARSYFPPDTECFIACGKTERRKVHGIRLLGWQDVIKEIFDL